MRLYILCMMPSVCCVCCVLWSEYEKVFFFSGGGMICLNDYTLDEKEIETHSERSTTSR